MAIGRQRSRVKEIDYTVLDVRKMCEYTPANQL